MQKEKPWKNIKKGFNINELLRYNEEELVGLSFREKPQVDGEYLIYYGENYDVGIEYKCKQDGTIIAVRHYW